MKYCMKKKKKLLLGFELISTQFFEHKFSQAEMIQQIFLPSEKLFQIPESSEWDELVHCKEFMSPVSLFKLIRSIRYIHCSWQLKKDSSVSHIQMVLPFKIWNFCLVFRWSSEQKIWTLNVHVIKSLLNHLNLKQYCLEFRSHS